MLTQEINEVVQKIAGADKPVSIWGDDVQQPVVRPMLYSIQFNLKVNIFNSTNMLNLMTSSLRFQGIQITATTPTNSAVRLETSLIKLDLSNRVLSANTSLDAVKNKFKPFVQLDVCNSKNKTRS